MTTSDYFHWDILILGIIGLVNFALLMLFFSKTRRLKRSNISLRKRIHDLEDDVKVLYSTTLNIGEKFKSVQKDNRILKEQQEQLSLKEPSQQSYKNAIQQIRNGDTTSKIVETSGLSLGEVELLRLLNASESASQSVANSK